MKTCPMNKQKYGNWPIKQVENSSVWRNSKRTQENLQSSTAQVQEFMNLVFVEKWQEEIHMKSYLESVTIYVTIYVGEMANMSKSLDEEKKL